MLKIAILTSEPNGWIANSMKNEAELLGFTCDILDYKNINISTDSAGELVVDTDDYDVIIPRVSEHDLEIKSMIMALMQKEHVNMVNTVSGISIASNKLYSQYVIANAKMDGVAAIPTKVIHDADQISTVAEQISYPVIVKMLSGTHGIGVMKCDSQSSFISIVQVMIEKFQTPVLVQDFIEHNVSYRTIVLGDRIVAANSRSADKSSNDFRTNSHRGASTEKFEVPENVRANSIKLAQLFELDFCAVDFLLDDDGQMTIFEVNGSPGLEKIQENFPEINLCEEVIKYAASKCNVMVDEVEPVDLTNTQDTVNDDIESDNQQVVISDTIEVKVRRLNNGKSILAKIDTGADSCSMHAENILVNDDTGILQFIFNGTRYSIPFDRAVKVKSANDSERRFKIMLDIAFDVNGSSHEFKDVEFTLTDRSHMEYEMLIGKNILSQIDAVIKV